jgi:hypothetical protein
MKEASVLKRVTRVVGNELNLQYMRAEHGQ